MKFKFLSLILLSTTVLNTWANTSVEAGNTIGLKLAAESSKALEGKNFMVSPLSLQEALALTSNGTSTDTKSQLESLFGAEINTINADAHKNAKAISFSLEQKKALQAENRYLNPAVVSINNSIWHTNGKTDGQIFAFSESFKQTAKKYYDAESASHDFTTQEAVKAINSWANEKTYGLIPTIIDLDALKPMLWVVMNATYIEASWKTGFRQLVDNVPAFNLADGSKVKAKMIQSTQTISYAKLADGSETAAIPFNTTEGSPELEFVIYLPSQSGNTQLFNSDFWTSTQEILAKRESRIKANVTLPKFSFDTSIEMKKDESLTESMGLNFLFQDHADFSVMGAPGSFQSAVGLIKQSSRIELDEKGVKAAAVTIIGGIRTTSVILPATLDFVVDRPFMFAIVEKSSKTILFVGSVADPR